MFDWSLRGYSTVFEILDRGSEENETSYKNSENPKMKIYPSAPDQIKKLFLSTTGPSGSRVLEH